MYLTLEMVKFKQPEPNKEIHKKPLYNSVPIYLVKNTEKRR